MMYPILYAQNEKAFDNNGIGVLSDAIKCIVTEERNGSFELEMQYPMSGAHFGEIAMRSIILAKPNPLDDAQPFRVYNISTPMNGVVTVNAEHISYDLSGYPLEPFTASSASDAMAKLKANSVQDHPFTFWTDITTSANMTVSAPTSTRALLGGIRGSVLDAYGGEYKFDRFSVRLYKERGADHGTTIRYGKNLTDAHQEKNCANVYTGVYPYWKSVDGELVQLPEKVVKASGEYGFTKILTIDFSTEWRDAPTEDQLRNRALRYIISNNIGVPKVSIKVSFVQLEQTEEYKNIAFLERVGLCDTVGIEFPQIGISSRAKVIKTVYDTILERYDAVHLGDSTGNIADTIYKQTEEEKDKPNSSWMNAAIASLTAKILGARGGAVRLLDTDADGMPDTLYVADNEDPSQAVKVWRWNYEGWAASRTGYNGPFVMGATLDDGILAEAVTAAKLVAGTIQSADDGKTFFLDLDNGILRGNFSELQLNSKGVVDGEHVRSSFAIDPSSVTVESGGTITFKGNSLAVDTDNFKLVPGKSLEVTGIIKSTYGEYGDYVQLEGGKIKIFTAQMGEAVDYIEMYSNLSNCYLLFKNGSGDDNVSLYNVSGLGSGLTFGNGAGISVNSPTSTSEQYKQHLEIFASGEDNYRMALGVHDSMWSLYPMVSGNLNLGTPNNRWGAVYVDELHVKKIVQE